MGILFLFLVVGFLSLIAGFAMTSKRVERSFLKRFLIILLDIIVAILLFGAVIASVYVKLHM